MGNGLDGTTSGITMDCPSMYNLYMEDAQKLYDAYLWNVTRCGTAVLISDRYHCIYNFMQGLLLPSCN